jgi:hypothetical protein
MRPELEKALELANELPISELAAFLGAVEQVRVTALARITSPTVARPDELLDVQQAAARLRVSPDYLYQNHKKFAFTRRIGRALRFSSAGIDRVLAQK